MKRLASASALAALALGLVFGARPAAENIIVRCRPGAEVRVTVTHGRFARSVTTMKTKAEEEWTTILQLGKLSLATELQASCDGLAELKINQGETTASLKPLPGQSTIRADIPRGFLYQQGALRWLAGGLLWALMIYAVLAELLRALKTPTVFDRALPFVCLSAVAALYVYYFPGYISSSTPSDVLFAVETDKISGWLGSLYTLSLGLLVDFVPRTPALLVPQSVTVFFVLYRFSLLGQTARSRAMLLAALAAIGWLLPLAPFYAEYFHRPVLAAWLLSLLVIMVFSALLKSDTVFEQSWRNFASLCVAASLLCLLRYDYFFVCPVLALFCVRSWARRAMLVGALVFSALVGPRILDNLNPRENDEWHLQYSLVSLWSYFPEISRQGALSEVEKRTVSKFYDLEKSSPESPAWPENFTPGTRADLLELVDVIYVHAKQRPGAFLLERASRPLKLLGLFGGKPWIATPPMPENYEIPQEMLRAYAAGAVKLEGDPAFGSFARIYAPRRMRAGFYIYGALICSILGIFLMRRFRRTALVGFIILFKAIVVALLAPIEHFSYMFDAYLLLGFIPVFATLEYRFAKNLN